jgi:ferredoxin-thioredoxin reductase catalytic subunit
MDTRMDVTPEEIGDLYQKLNKDAAAAGYYLNPDKAMVYELLNGYLVNQKRFGYPACPCRLAKGAKDEDMDIICPCDYRDPDLDDYNACYCSLYVSREAAEGKVKVNSIPERRPPSGKRHQTRTEPPPAALTALPLPVWRCKVCGYLCARENPPGVCPICKAGKERFERFI